MSYKDYYTILGVARTAGAEEIQRAYRKLARKYHPDINKKADAEDHFKELGEAYGVLKDEKKRALYDRHGESWKAVSEGRVTPSEANNVKVEFNDAGFSSEGFVDLNDIFEAFFKKGTSRGGPSDFERRRSVAGADHETTVTLTLEQAFEGGEREIRLLDRSSGKEQHLTVQVPQGVQSGQRLRLASQGGKGFDGGPDGDLYLLIQLIPHAVFRLDNGDLHVRLSLSPWEAALGGTVDLKTLEETVKLKIPSGSSTGRRIRLRNKGYFKSAKLRGDLFAEIRVDVPSMLTDSERELFKKLALVSQFRPRDEQGRAS
jgi:curved DNA-binding protein